mgnify:CR=1 FL=1
MPIPQPSAILSDWLSPFLEPASSSPDGCCVSVWVALVVVAVLKVVVCVGLATQIRALLQYSACVQHSFPQHVVPRAQQPFPQQKRLRAHTASEIVQQVKLGSVQAVNARMRDGRTGLTSRTQGITAMTTALAES